MLGRGPHNACWRWVFPLLVLAALWPATPAGAADNKLQARLVTVHYQDKEDLERFGRQVMPSALARTLDSIFIGGKEGNSEDLATFLDNLFIRVQKILDMPLKGLRVKIVVHRDEETVTKVFRSLASSGGALAAHYQSSRTLPAFYDRQTQTIHVQGEDIDVGILAHEMAHCVTSNYFAIQPPPTVAELMSQFVERALRKEKY